MNDPVYLGLHPGIGPIQDQSGLKGMTESSTLELILADDHPVFRSGMRSIATSVLGEVNLREAGTAALLKKQLDGAPADLLILDIFFPGLDPENDLKFFRATYSLMAILVVSMMSERSAVERLLRAGANGFVCKRCEPELMISSIRDVMDGKRPVCLPQTGPGRPTTSADNPVSGLPPRQKDVLRLICFGLSNKQIARELDLSESTVRAHVSAVFQKLGVTNRTAAATLGVSQGALASPHQADQS